MAHKNPSKSSGKHYIDTSKPLPYSVTKPRSERPSLGTGMAEKTARTLENRTSRVDRAVERATGGSVGADGGSKTDRTLEQAKKKR